MKADTASAWGRLRSALYNPSKARKPGTCLVLQADLELLLAEVEQLSNMQMARYLIKITLEELRNGDPAPEAKPRRAVERRTRRPAVLRGPHWPAADCGVAEIAGPFTFGDGPLQEF